MDCMVRMTGPGGVERLEVLPCAPQEPGPGEIRIRHDAIGVNFLDIYHRTGLYPLPGLPAVLGVEGAGVVEAVGPGVAALAPGQRVAYCGAPVGAYAATRLLPAARAVPLPEGIAARLAAAAMLRGLTAHMLLTRVHPVGPDTTLLVLAAAGGLGALLVRWASRLGARVIGTVGSPAKAALAERAGAGAVIVGRDVDLPAEVAALTGGRGVDFAVDGVGGAGLLKVLGCVRPFGTVANVGQAAGPVPPLRIEQIGSRRLSRPSVMAYSADPEAYPAAAAALFAALREGIVPEIGAEYPLAEAARAQADLEAGRTVGSLLLIP
ncbi:NADPH2:quinone reductase [Tistlia consotensis]|uniref:NADPH2:quinone reductase n=2 Tax=Tistlia TaxID=1321364 RepID=A0A1Y6CUT5_9PROT|nr:NADPH2:quinone reductase [Tistlia consotensis USBA 355]SNS22168.1 NADPH2:quinone reductase [Tistlia consotensis]